MSISVTNVGRVIASSGLQVATARYLLTFIEENSEKLVSLLPSDATSDEDAFRALNEDIPFLLFEAALCSPEYVSATGGRSYRNMPYQCVDTVRSVRAGRLLDYIITRPPSRNPGAINCAELAVDWINGHSLVALEGRFNDLRGGQLRSMFSDLGQIMGGLAEILLEATDRSKDDSDRASFLQGKEALVDQVRRLIYIIRRLCVRLDRGLPDGAIWLTDLNYIDNRRRKRRVLSNVQILALWGADLVAAEKILDLGKTAEMIRVLRPVHSQPDAAIRLLREAVSEWRLAERETLRIYHKRQLPASCSGLVDKFYDDRGTQFEDAIASIFQCLTIVIDDRDAHGKTSFPDFLITLVSPRDVSLECKSKQGVGHVDFNDASDVLRKSMVNGLDSSHCVTVCHPFVSSDVYRKIDKCLKLSVVDSVDFADALVRLYKGKIDIGSFKNWLTEPGQPRRQTIPRRMALSALTGSEA